MLKELGAKEIQKVMVQASEKIYALIYSLTFVSLSTTEVHSCVGNAGRSIKESDTVLSWMITDVQMHVDIRQSHLESGYFPSLANNLCRFLTSFQYLHNLDLG